MSEKLYDFAETLAELDAGVFLNKISRAVRDVAIGVTDHGRKGKVIIELNIGRIGESNQITMAHKLKYDQPTKRGRVIEEDTTETALYANGRGLSVLPENQCVSEFDFQEDKD